MEMILCMNWMIWCGFAIVFLLAFPERLIPFTASFWIAGLVLYGGYYLLPFRSGWAKALLVGGAAIVSIWQGLLGGKMIEMFQNAGWLGLAYTGIFSIGFDLKGIVGDQRSEAEGSCIGWGLKDLATFTRQRVFTEVRLTSTGSFASTAVRVYRYAPWVCTQLAQVIRK